ncbi:MAG: 3-oxoadipate enol-lactonase [Hylemonella sp.]
MDKKKIRLGDIEIAYTVQGQGPWITLSHSLACDTTMWDPQMNWLAQRYTVLRFDTRGHGQSSAPPGPYTLEQLADDVHGLFQALGVERTHWVGLSMGGMIGQTYALKHPGVFATMALCDTTSRRPPNAEAMWNERIQAAQANGMQGVLEGTLSRWFDPPFRASHPEVIERISQGILATPVNGFCGCCAAIAQIDTLDRLQEIRCPTLVLVGENDHGTPPAMAKRIHENLPDSEFVVIPDAGHISNVEQTEKFDAALKDFLSRHDQRG